MKEIELRYLRDELAEDKKYVFERTLILALLGVLFGKISGIELLPVLNMVSLVFLSFNLWLIINRLKSSARIIAYIHFFIEENPSQYKGWESYLSIYRRKVTRDIYLDAYNNTQKDKSTNKFASGVVLFHIALILIFDFLFFSNVLKTVTFNPLSYDKQAIKDLVFSTIVLTINVIVLIILCRYFFSGKISKLIGTEEKIAKDIMTNAET